ncbi:type VII secretion target [Mycolicibacterium senegalense]|uniref:type VII secretion target n=1 Tax=Mycolicibacterium TaxID=1866885 RepID=UPI0032048852
MGLTLRVDPTALHAAASDIHQVGADVPNLTVSSALASTGAALSTLASGEACQRAATVVESACERLSGDLTELSTKLRTAAQMYTDVDGQSGAALDKTMNR